MIVGNTDVNTKIFGNGYRNVILATTILIAERFEVNLSIVQLPAQIKICFACSD